MQAEALSVVIITLDERERLPACLDSVAFADEILVVDSGSRDDTVAYAGSRGCRVIAQDWLGYGAQKQCGVDHARHDWVLCVDADERVSDTLCESIRSHLEAPTTVAMRMPRRNRFLGRWLRHGEGYPDRSLRLFDRRHARWSRDPVHEKVETDAPVGDLDGDLLHESQQTLRQYLDKQNRYTSLQAEALFAAGTGASVAKLVYSPLVRFVKMYFLRLGCLDGVAGLVHIAIGCHNSFMKYAKLIEMHRRDGDRAG